MRWRVRETLSANESAQRDFAGIGWFHALLLSSLRNLYLKCRLERAYLWEEKHVRVAPLQNEIAPKCFVTWDCPPSEHEVTNILASCELLCEERGEVSVTNFKPMFPGEKLTHQKIHHIVPSQNTLNFWERFCAKFYSSKREKRNEKWNEKLKKKKKPETPLETLSPVQLPKSFSLAFFTVLHPQFQTQIRFFFHNENLQAWPCWNMEFGQQRIEVDRCLLCLRVSFAYMHMMRWQETSCLSKRFKGGETSMSWNTLRGGNCVILPCHNMWIGGHREAWNSWSRFYNLRFHVSLRASYANSALYLKWLELCIQSCLCPPGLLLGPPGVMRCLTSMFPSGSKRMPQMNCVHVRNRIVSLHVCVCVCVRAHLPQFELTYMFEGSPKSQDGVIIARGWRTSVCKCSVTLRIIRISERQKP